MNPHNNNKQPTTKEALKQLGAELGQVAKIVHREGLIKKVLKGIFNYNKLSHKDKELVASSVTLLILVVALFAGSIWIVFY